MKLNTKIIIFIFLIFSLIFQNVLALTYRVRPGDNPEKIAKKFGISVKTLLKANKIKNPKRLKVGQKLYIPVKRKKNKKSVKSKKSYSVLKGKKCRYVYTVKKGDALSLIAKRFKVSSTNLKRWNNLKSNRLYIGQRLCIKPVKVSKKHKVSKKTVNRHRERKARTRYKYKTVIGYYRVKRGDNLIRIARKYGITVKKLVKLNRLKKPYRIYPGQRLKVPKRIKVKVKSYVRKYKPVREFKPKKKLDFRWPVEGKVVKGFINSEAERHVGLDIKTNCSEKIVASEDGKVIYAGDSIKTFGNLIIIRHPNRYNTVYGHVGKILVKEGQRVKKGETIGTVGKLDNKNCGIYFEVRKNTYPVNPLSVLGNK